MIFNLMLQIAPFLAATECLFKLLALIALLIDVIKGITGPTPLNLPAPSLNYLKRLTS